MEIIPVIHYVDDEQLYKNVRTCNLYKLHKIFLIDHGMNNANLLNCALFHKKQNPHLWIGLNLLGEKTIDAINEDLPGIDGLWSDTALTEEEYNSHRVFKGMYFGGLAFKYQPQPTDLEAASIIATKTTDVATTSGPGTGKAASLVKIQNIRKYLGSHPMAIASGVDSTNVKQYKDLGVDYCLVASSIINNEEIIQYDLLDNLLEAIKY